MSLSRGSRGRMRSATGKFSPPAWAADAAARRSRMAVCDTSAVIVRSSTPRCRPDRTPQQALTAQHYSRRQSANLRPVASFDLAALIAQRGDERYDLQSRYVNPQLSRMLHAIGFDKIYTRAEGAYLYDDAGNEYLDMLAGFGVFALGRHHPVVRQAIHDVVDLGLADLTQFDAPPLAGLLAEKLLAKTPHLDRVYFGNSGTEAVEASLKFARFATRRKRVLYCDHAFHGLTTGSLSVNGAAEFRKGFEPLLPDAAIPFGDLSALRRELAKGDVAGLIVEPDIVVAAKALSGGYIPVGATMARDEVFQKVFSTMDRVLVHDSTFGSNA